MKYNMYSVTLLVICALFQSFYTQYMDIPASRFGSSYWKQWNKAIISFDDAQRSCSEYGGSLAIFPSANEANTLLDLMTIDLRLNISGEKADVHHYWIGLKFNGSKRYWVNSVNNHTITSSQWSWPLTLLTFDDSNAPNSEGCQAVKILWNNIGNYVESSVVKVACSSWSSVRSYICEKSDTTHHGNKFWSEWSRWSEDNCESTGAAVSHRIRSCNRYDCEVLGLPIEEETKVCCDIPLSPVSKGMLHTMFWSQQKRTYEGQVVQLKCDSGYTHPETRYRINNITCVSSPVGGGIWSPPIPTHCQAVDCGSPPLGVHARPPVYTGTKYLDVASYYCQPGFRETTKNKTIVTLRCSESDEWVGLNLNPEIKPVCQPVTNVVMEWLNFPLSEGGNNYCYRLHHRGQTWQEAMDTCDGDLLYIEDEVEFNFLKQSILEPQDERSVLWLAGKKKMNEGSFSWYLSHYITTDIVGSYTNWEANGNYTLPYHRDLCIAANYSSGTWRWLNVTCDNKFEFVCKTLQKKRHGGWSEWTKWSTCNRRFIRERSHVCNNPHPFCGGDDCVGDAVEKSHCCEEPGKSQHSTIAFSSIVQNVTEFLVPGDYYTYRCNPGYEHFDASQLKNITCLLNGSWSWPAMAPQCTPLKCAEAGNGTHSYYIRADSERNEHGSIVNYNCEDGFAAGKAPGSLQIGQITCQYGLWDQPPLQCYARVCAQDYDKLDPAEYERRFINRNFVRLVDRTSHKSWGWSATDNTSSLYGDKYRYFCKRGYQVNSRIDYNITCTYDGLWRRDETDINLHPDTCEPVSCPSSPPQPLTNSLWISGADPDNKQKIGKYLDQANYKCTEGYQVNTNIEGDERLLLTYSFTCGANNDWKDQYSPDYCKRQSCGDPGPGSNIENRIGRTYLYGDTVDYVCKQGYVYNGVMTRRRILCQLHELSNATIGNIAYVRWNNSALQCSRVTCGDPGLGRNVSREGRDFDYGSIVTYTCIPQHVLIGGGLERLWVRCTALGTWNGTAPSCEPAQIVSDFSVVTYRPYVVKAQWIVSEKYDTILITFNVEFTGLPAYIPANGSAVYVSNVPAWAAHDATVTTSASRSGVIHMYILTRPDYIYKVKLHSSTKVTYEPWSGMKLPIELYTGGGLPFLGSVQERNLPYIIPLGLLPAARKRPRVTSAGVDSLAVTFDVSMFSEQNSTILGFTVIVREVHPWHNTEETLDKEGYHDRYPEALFTWKRLDYFTDYKYITWPAYYALPFCNIFDSNADCQNKVGPIPLHATIYREHNSRIYTQSAYSRFLDTDEQADRKVSLVIGSAKDCGKYDENTTCNGPLRRNRKFCVKLRAYTKYGWNDSLCSNIVAVEKQLEFDYALVAPSILAATPFIIFLSIIGYMRYRKFSRRKQRPHDEDDEDERAADKEGDLIRTWTMGMGEKNTHGSGLQKRNKNARGKIDNIAEMPSLIE